MKHIKRTAWVLLIAVDIILLPCAFSAIYDLISDLAYKMFGTDIYGAFSRILLGFMGLAIILRLFYILYIIPSASAVLFIISAVNNKRSGVKLSVKKIIFFILLWIIFILGAVSVEEEFGALMGI